MKRGSRGHIEAKIIWKYVAMVLGLAAIAGLLATSGHNPFSLPRVADGLFYSVVTSLIVALFYDLGTRRDLLLVIDEERAEQRRVLTDRVLGMIDFGRLSSNDALALAEQVARSDRMMEGISTSLLGGQGHDFFYTWLKPLVDRRVLESATVEHRLSRIDGRPERYMMEFRQTFRAAAAKNSFVIVFTCDNDLYNDFITSGIGVDELVGTPQEEWSEIDDQIRSLRFDAYRTRLGKREHAQIRARTLDAPELAERLGRSVDGSFIRGFEYGLLPDSDWTYEYAYRAVYSLSDPYYYWTAVNPMFVRKLVIDYRELKPLIGRASANCILGSAVSNPEHDADAGIYTVNIDSLVWPGQGALIVWRPVDSAEKLQQMRSGTAFHGGTPKPRSAPAIEEPR